MGNQIKIIQWAVLIAAGWLCFGCGNRSQYGKFTEEQMQQIGLANKYDLPDPSGNSMVMAVFSDTITSDEILGITELYLKPMAEKTGQNVFQEQARPFVQQAIRGKVTDILLYQEAKKNAPDNIDDILEKAVEGEINRFVASYGNNYALAESKVREMGMDWRSFREYQRKLVMTQSYLSSKLKEEKRFSYPQLMDFYNANKDELFCTKGKVGFSVINIQPQQLTTEQIGEGETPQVAAERIAAGLIEQLYDQSADFSELAKQYHGDLAPIGGTVSPVTPGTDALAEPYNTLESHAVAMQVGQIQGPIELDGQLFILKLDVLEVAGCKPFDEVKLQIEQHLLFTHRQQQYKELVDNLDSMASFAQMDRFTQFCINQAYHRWGQL